MHATACWRIGSYAPEYDICCVVPSHCWQTFCIYFLQMRPYRFLSLLMCYLLLFLMALSTSTATWRKDPSPLPKKKQLAPCMEIGHSFTIKWRNPSVTYCQLPKVHRDKTRKGCNKVSGWTVRLSTKHTTPVIAIDKPWLVLPMHRKFLLFGQFFLDRFTLIQICMTYTFWSLTKTIHFCRFLLLSDIKSVRSISFYFPRIMVLTNIIYLHS